MAPKLPMDSYMKELYESKGMFRYKTTSHKKVEILQLMELIDLEDYCSRFELKNLPKELNLTSEEIFKMLYYKYSLAFAKIENKFLILPYSMQKNLDVYGRQRYLTLVPCVENENLTKALAQYVLSIIYTDDDIIDDVNQAVIIKDRISRQMSTYDLPRYQMNQPLLEIESVFIPYMRTNLMLATGVKLLEVQDVNEAEDLKQSLAKMDELILDGTPYMAVIGKTPSTDFGNEPVAKATDYFQALQNCDNFRLSTMGLQNGGLFRKEERMNIPETENQESNSNSRLDLDFQQLKYSIDLINKKFNLNIEVVNKAKEIKNEININNNDNKNDIIKDEEKELENV